MLEQLKSLVDTNHAKNCVETFDAYLNQQITFEEFRLCVAKLTLQEKDCYRPKEQPEAPRSYKLLQEMKLSRDWEKLSYGQRAEKQKQLVNDPEYQKYLDDKLAIELNNQNSKLWLEEVSKIFHDKGKYKEAAEINTIIDIYNKNQFTSY